MAIQTVRLSFGPGGIGADPGEVELQASADVLCFQVDAEPSDVVTIDIEEKKKKGKKVKGPFKKHPAQGKRGIFKRTGSGSCESHVPDQVPSGAFERWKYDVIWQKGKTVARLDPMIKIKN